MNKNLRTRRVTSFSHEGKLQIFYIFSNLINFSRIKFWDSPEKRTTLSLRHPRRPIKKEKIQNASIDLFFGTFQYISNQLVKKDLEFFLT